jgi:hypothetical protein
VKKHDLQLGEQIDLHKRGRKAHGAQPQPLQASEPQNGHEFFFSNVMVKVYQLPMLFSRSSEEQESAEEGCFIVLIFEKQTRKRSFAKTQSQLVKLTKHAEIRNKKGVRYFEELLYQRDSKMRRFCNYFVTLFNQKKINPFTQFVGQAKLREVKQRVRNKMDFYTSEDPSKIKELEALDKEEKRKKDEDDKKARLAQISCEPVEEFNDINDLSVNKLETVEEGRRKKQQA